MFRRGHPWTWLVDVREAEKSRPIGWIGIVVIRDGAVPKLLLYALYLRDALMQPLRMLLRLGLPVAERFGRDRQERGTEERRIWDHGSSEKEEFLRTGDNQRGVAGAAVYPEPVERQLA